jgi:hypothetical protein
MIPLFVYGLPNWLFGTIVVGAFVLFSLAGQFVVGRFRPHWFGEKDYNDIVGQYLSAAGVFFGITLGLISVATWENFGAVDTAVTNEASSVGVLYRVLDSYPEPHRTTLTEQLRAYTRHEIDVSWPKQRIGITPGKKGNALIAQLYSDLVRFEPKTEGQKALHAEALHQFSNMIESRRQRLTGVNTQLPSIVWVVVAGGSILNMALMWLLVVDQKALHYLLTTILAALLGLLVFLLAIMDHPFRGAFSVGPEAFELIYDQLMTK